MTEMPPIVSIIVLNWNGAQFLPRCVQSLHDQTLRNIQIIFADNGSTDESVALIRRDYPEADVIEFGENLGYAVANNRAAAAARAPYLLFLNNDTHLDHEAIAVLVAAAESQSGLGIWAPKQKTYDGARVLHVGLGLDILGYPCTGKLLYADGSCLFIRRSLFQELGGFDPQYFMFFEDADLCWRAWLQGYGVGAVPDAVIYHKFGGTAGSSVAEGGEYVTSRRKRRLAHRNQIITVLKNYSTPMLCVIMPLLAVLTAGEVCVLAATGQRAAIRDSYLPAWRDLLRKRGCIRAQRHRVQTSRRVSDWSIIRRMEWKLVTVGLFFRIGAPRIT